MENEKVLIVTSKSSILFITKNKQSNNPTGVSTALVVVCLIVL